MEMRSLGHTGLKTGVVGLGLEHMPNVSKEDTVTIIRKALDNGVNYFDAICAEPDVRDNLGTAFKSCREKAIISGHLGAYMANGQPSITRDIKTCREYIEDLLRRLGTDYIDVVNLLFVDEPQDYDRAMGPGGLLELAQALRSEGKARYIKLSSHRVPTAMGAVDSGFVDALMFPVNPLFDLLPGETVLDNLWKEESYNTLEDVTSPALKERHSLYRLCEQKGVGIVVMKGFAAGWLFTQYLYGDNPPMTPVQCIHYALSKPGVATVAVGVRNVNELDAALRYAVATDEERSYGMAVKNLRWHNKGVCLYCNHCLPCPVGINIGEILRISDSAAISSTDELVGRYKELKVNAANCVKCGECSARCPFRVDVLAEMEKAARRF